VGSEDGSLLRSLRRVPADVTRTTRHHCWRLAAGRTRANHRHWTQYSGSGSSRPCRDVKAIRYFACKKLLPSHVHTSRDRPHSYVMTQGGKRRTDAWKCCSTPHETGKELSQLLHADGEQHSRIALSRQPSLGPRSRGKAPLSVCLSVCLSTCILVTSMAVTGFQPAWV
jgi:hypothetical protein